MARVVVVNRYFAPDESPTSVLAADLAGALAEHHAVLALASRQLLEDSTARLATEEQRGRLRIHRVWSTSWGRQSLPGRALDYATFLASALGWMLWHLRRDDVVVAKTDPPMLGVVAGFAARLRGARLVNWLQDIYPETAWRLGVGSGRSILARLLRALRNASLRRAAVNVVISQGMGRFLQETAAVPAPAVVPNWAEDHGAAGPTETLRAELGLGGRFVVGYSGNLGRAHPVEPLMRLADAMQAHAEVHFLFSGGGTHMARLREHVRRRGCANWTFLPYQPRDRLAALLATSNLHVTTLDARLERLILPSKLYGILSAGRPVLHIGDPHGELAGVLAQSGCGWAVRGDDPQGLVQLLLRLAQDPDALRAAGFRARETFEKTYVKSIALARWREVLDPLLSSVAAPGRLG